MNKFRIMQKCALANFRNWAVSPKIWIITGVFAVFSMWNLSGVLEYSVDTGIRVTPWVFPYFFSMPAMYLVYGFLTIVLFSEAPFRNPLSDFMEIRTGKRMWIGGQCLFVVEAAFLYALVCFLITVLCLLPRIFVTGQWGKLIQKMVYGGDNASSGIYFSAQVFEQYSALEAVFYSLLFLWLVSAFLGMLILASHVVIGKNAGDIVAGFFAFLSYYSMYVGSMTFGNGIFKVSPVNWINIGTLLGSKYDMPDKYYAFSFLVIGTVVFSIAGIKGYERKSM